MHVLVTGGAGFIGANFVHTTVEERPDATVTVLDKIGYAGNPASIAGLDRVKLVVGDLADRDLVDGLFGKSTEGAEERDAELVTKGRGAGNVRRHGVKGNESDGSGAASFRGRGRIVANRAGSGAGCQSRSPVTPVTKASRPPPGVTSPHAVIFHSFAVPPASTSSKPVDVSTL